MKKKEKAPKAPKEKKPKKPKEPKEPKDPSEKKKIPKILFIILPVILLLAVAGVVVYLLFFRTASVEEEVDKLTKRADIYKVGSDEIVSLESAVEEGMVKRNSVETPIIDEDTTMEDMTQFTYHYREVNDTPSKVAATYVDLLCGEEQGFIVTDEEHHEVEEEPDMTTTLGSVILAKVSADTVAAGEEGGEEEEDSGDAEAAVDKLVEVIVAWSEKAVAVRVSQVEGTILPPVVPPDPAEIQREPLALQAQLEYFNNLDPAKLGLPGDFMSEYRIYPGEGLVRVSGEPCRVLNVYLTDLPAGTNTFMGTYYLSTDNSKVFKLDDTGAIVGVNMD